MTSDGASSAADIRTEFYYFHTFAPSVGGTDAAAAKPSRWPPASRRHAMEECSAQAETTIHASAIILGGTPRVGERE
jgi:hypothetical protein